MMILFLDFDGVLHPIHSRQGCENDFCKLPLLEDWLRVHQHVNVVISSSWRVVMKMEALRLIFSKEVRDRIIDKCPVLPHEPEPGFWRHTEIMAWITKTGYTGPWVALDDAIHEFPPDSTQLVACDYSVGLDERIIAELTLRIKS